MDLLKLQQMRARLDQRRTDWYRIEAKAGSDTADVYIYDEIGYWGVTAKDFVKDLSGITAKTLTVHVNSPGGDVFDGIAIYNAIKSHPANVTTVVDGLAASAASYITQAGDTVVMKPNATMMIHDASGICMGNADDMEEMKLLLNKASDNIASIYAKHAGGTVADWRAVMQAETWYTADEAVEVGLADEVDTDDESVSNKKVGAITDVLEEPQATRIDLDALGILLKGVVK